MFRLLLLGIILVIPTYISALNNGLGLTPPMGWLSWERFRCNIDCVNDPNNCISEKLYKDMADRMAEDGWLQAGYRYVNIDDCWAELKRDSNGTLVANKQRFPSGIPNLASYVQSRGLSLGIYGDLGTATCGGYPGTTFDTITHDAQTFANWTIDSLKLDGCNIDLNKMPQGYPMMTKALNATGRPILYACSWPAYWLGVNTSIDWQSIATNCNYWRLFDDIQDDWDSVVSIIKYWGDQQAVLAPLAGPGHFNDPDMIICGNFALSIDECIAQFSLWAIWAAPLYLSADLRSIRPEYREILLNTEVIAVNQDALGIQGTRIYEGGSQSIWVRPLSQGGAAVALLNLDSGGTPSPASFNLTMAGFTGAKARVRDLYAHLDLGIIGQSDRISAQVNIHGCRLFRVSAVSDMEVEMFEPISSEKLEAYGIVIERGTLVIGGGDHDQKPHTKIGGGDHDKQPHSKPIIGGGDHDKQPHTVIGGGDHDKQPHAAPIIGGGDHDQQPHTHAYTIIGDDHDNKQHVVIGGDNHDKQSHTIVIIGGGDHDKKSHTVIGGDNHDQKPHTIIGGGDHDKKSHGIIGRDDHDQQPHTIIGGGDHDKQPHSIIGGDNHDNQPHDRHSILFGGDAHDRQPHGVLIGGGDHDRQSHTRPTIGGDNHDMRAHGIIIGGGDHDKQPPRISGATATRGNTGASASAAANDRHSIMFGGGDHDLRPHNIGGGDHDKRPHNMIGGDNHDQQSHGIIGGGSHDYTPHGVIFGGDDHDQHGHGHGVVIGGDDHDQRGHGVIGGDDDDARSHGPVIGGDDHDQQPHTKIGGGDHDQQSHTKPIIRGGDHDKKPHTIVGGGDHDQQPHTTSRPLLGRPGHGRAPAPSAGTMIGGDDHDNKPHTIIGGDNHDQKPHTIIGGGDHDQLPHTKPIIGGGDHDNQPHTATSRPLLGRPGHGQAPAPVAGN